MWARSTWAPTQTYRLINKSEAMTIKELHPSRQGHEVIPGVPNIATITNCDTEWMTRTTMLFQTWFFLQVCATSLLVAGSVIPSLRPLVLWHGLGCPYSRPSCYMLTLFATLRWFAFLSRDARIHEAHWRSPSWNIYSLYLHLRGPRWR